MDAAAGRDERRGTLKPNAAKRDKGREGVGAKRQEKQKRIKKGERKTRWEERRGKDL